jgi:hypothetical protein
MAGMLCVVNTPSEIALVAATAKTLVLLTAPSNHRLLIKRLRVTFDGTSPTAEPGIVEVFRYTTAGTFTSGTPRLKGAGSETPQATFGYNATAEPTTGDLLEILEADRGYEVFYPLGMEIVIPGGGRVGIRATFAAIVNALATIEYEE